VRTPFVYRPRNSVPSGNALVHVGVPRVFSCLSPDDCNYSTQLHRPRNVPLSLRVLHFMYGNDITVLLIVF